MPVFNFNKESRQSVDLNSADFINFLTGGDSDKYVSADQALANSDLYSLISHLSADLALVRLQTSSKRWQKFLTDPTTVTNGFSFWQAMFAQLLLDGNAYAYRWRNDNGVDLYWEGLKPSQVTVYKNLNGTGLIYDVNFDDPNIGTITNVPQGDIIHLRLMAKDSIGLTGYSPLRALTAELSIKNKSNDLTENALSQSVTSPGILTITHGGKLNGELRTAHARAMMKQIQNGLPVVLDDLETWTPLEVKGDVAKLLSQVDWTSKQIAKVYGLPDSYLNGEGDQQSNLDQENNQYAKALKRYVGPIVSELNSKLNTTIVPDLRPAIDAVGDGFAGRISNMVKDGALSPNQAQFVLQRAGYFPQDMPKFINEGGEKDGNNTD